MRDALNMKRVRGVQADASYKQIKSVIMNNKMKTHEMEENRKIEEIRKNNAHLLDKLLYISKGKKCLVKQSNLRVERAPSKSLNYISKKKEAERIDREN